MAVRRGRKKFRFKNRLLSLDSTTVELCASMFDWARWRQTKGAVKLHLLQFYPARHQVTLVQAAGVAGEEAAPAALAPAPAGRPARLPAP